MSSEIENEQEPIGDNTSEKRNVKFAYLKLYWALAKKIRDGEYPQGALIPTESQLMKEFGVSRTTVRRAVSILAEEGMLKVTQGSGTCITNLLPFHRFDNITHIQEMAPITLEREFVHIDTSVDEVSVSAEEAYVLEVNPGDMVYRVNRLCRMNDEVFSIRSNLIPKTLAPDLPIHEKELANVYPVLSKYYGISFAAAIEDISVRGATQIEAQILGIERNSPVYYIVRTARSNKGPMERAYSVMHPNSYKLRIHMNTLPGDAILKLLEKEG